MSQRTTPPFRADHVGSLLRPAALKDARAKHALGDITAAALKEIEDAEIIKVVKKQEEVGLQLATDGEFRRSWWHFDFFRGLQGVDLVVGPPIKFHGVTPFHVLTGKAKKEKGPIPTYTEVFGQSLLR